jgi:NAD(P)H-nitrite reductase large subunit
MGGHGAFPGSPFNDRLRENKAIVAGGKLFDFLAAGALLNDGMAAPTIELAASLVHEKALNTLLNAIANHGYHVPSFEMTKLNSPENPGTVRKYFSHI